MYNWISQNLLKISCDLYNWDYFINFFYKHQTIQEYSQNRKKKYGFNHREKIKLPVDDLEDWEEDDDNEEDGK